MKKYLIIIICSISFVNTSIGNPDSLKIVELEIELDKLEEKVTILNQVNDKILKSVYFTVGSIITVLLGLGLLTYFTNLKLNNKKFEDLSSDLQKKLASQKEHLINELNKISEESKSSSKKFIESSMSDKLKYQSDNIKWLQRDIYLNRIVLRDIIRNKDDDSYEGFSYLNKYSNLNNHIANLELEIKIDVGWTELGDRLKKIEKIIDEREISLEDKKTLENVFEKLPDRFKETGDFIKEKIKLSRISDY